MAAILGAISVITAVESLNILMILVCIKIYIHYINYCLKFVQIINWYVEKTTIMNCKRFITICGYGYAMAAILDAIRKWSSTIRDINHDINKFTHDWDTKTDL